MYNIDSNRDDIKLIKQIDFVGVFIIYNLDDDIYHIGKSEKVLRKGYRYFTGYERQDIYQEWKSNVHFAVRVVKFYNSGYKNINQLVNVLQKQYGYYEHKLKNEEN